MVQNMNAQKRSKWFLEQKQLLISNFWVIKSRTMTDLFLFFKKSILRFMEGKDYNFLDAYYY